MKEKLAKLIDVKSVVTLSLTGLFIYLGAKGDVHQNVLTIYTTIIAFYFGTQTGKK